jgi:hypothetical protein
MERRGEVVIMQYERPDNPCDAYANGGSQPSHDGMLRLHTAFRSTGPVFRNDPRGSRLTGAVVLAIMVL